MPGAMSYSTQYVEATRARVAEQITMYQRFAAAATTPAAAEAIREWGPVYFASLVVGLEHAFVHRAGDHPRPGPAVLDEMRTIATSIERHDGFLTVDPATPYDPAASVLGLEPGASIALDVVRFERLAEAFLTAIDATFT